ncbi:hypothetical protein SAMN05216557_10794 [Sphingomonas carotinifaciens]|uniref:Uncharacterized protein n=3 Tax=Sphingomonas carotinifaciens TaxID=1166323 RepID=A0A1G7PV82_9SPHN|nr:hypothetical protein SAMN05216557_10794 [Sphingomonas carotinifaciens]
MTSIAAATNAGRQMMDMRISSAVQSGRITSTDQSAFKTALDSIDSSLAASTTATANATTGRIDMRSKMQSLIEEQVSAGTLSSDQAATLQQMFAPGGPPPGGSRGGENEGSGAGQDGSSVGGMSGVRQSRGMQGPPPPPPPSFDMGSGSDTSATTATSSAGVDDQLNALVDLIEKLRSSLGSTTYAAAGSSGTDVRGSLINASA